MPPNIMAGPTAAAGIDKEGRATEPKPLSNYTAPAPPAGRASTPTLAYFENSFSAFSFGSIFLYCSPFEVTVLYCVPCPGPFEITLLYSSSC